MRIDGSHLNRVPDQPQAPLVTDGTTGRRHLTSGSGLVADGEQAVLGSWDRFRAAFERVQDSSEARVEEARAKVQSGELLSAEAAERTADALTAAIGQSVRKDSKA